MLFDLLTTWEEKFVPGLAKKPLVKKSMDDYFLHATFEFSRPPKVIFVRDFENFEVISTYDQMEPLHLNQEAQERVKWKLSQLKKNPRFYNGRQMLLTGVVYDTDLNVLYVRAKRCRYAVLETLRSEFCFADAALCRERLYKVGGLFPFVTEDHYTCFMQRRSLGFFSSVAGFAESEGPRDSLEDIIGRRAHEEALEEALEDEAGNPRVSFSEASVTGLSVRRTEQGVGTIDFVAPIFLGCGQERLEQILRSNVARDKHEHTGNFVLVPLDPEDRGRAVLSLRNPPSYENPRPGRFLYHPELVGASRVANSRFFGNVIPAGLADSTMQIVPASFFAPKLLCRPSEPEIRAREEELRREKRSVQSSVS